ncbi:MAG: response regulator [Streptosporangiaceae bacterium]
MTGDRPVRVVVADDQTIVRDGLVMLVDLLPNVEVVGAAADGEAAVALVAERDPDIVLMDVRMPRVDGVEATRRIHGEYPRTRVVVLTTYADDESVFAALRAGARGYLTKDASAEEIARAIETVHAGEALLDPGVQHRLLESLAAGSDRSCRSSRGRPREQLPDGLTGREAEVLAHIAAGRSNAEIAAALYVSEATVKTHVNNLFAKIGARNRAQAVTYAYRNGLASLD